LQTIVYPIRYYSIEPQVNRKAIKSTYCCLSNNLFCFS
jgi:hypothetical protein